MVIFGCDAGLVAPGFSVVETTQEKPTGTVLMSQCFIADHDESIKKVTDHDRHRIVQIVARFVSIVEEYSPDVIVSELPTGAGKSAGAIKGMAFSTSMTVATISAIKHFYTKKNIEAVYITPIQNKKGSTGCKTWSSEHDIGKWRVFHAVKDIWPEVDWPRKKRKSLSHLLDESKCWAIADSLSCVATYLRSKGILTTVFE